MAAETTPGRRPKLILASGSPRRLALMQQIGLEPDALLPADVVVATENAWLSPLPPEGASAIVHGDVDHAPEMAEQQRVSALDLHELGTVHHVVPEPADDTPEALASAVAAEVGHQLRRLADLHHG